MKQTSQAKQVRKTASATASPLTQDPVDRSLPITRRELFLFSVVLICGIALRLSAFSHSAVEHFDEGVYASNLYFGPPDYAYPLQRFYAPPLLPALIEAGMILQLPPNVAAILPSFLAGCGTIVALWWFARSWFGLAAGLAAAGLAAFNDFQILFSTAALTDELLGLWLVLAVDAIARSLHRGDFRWAVGAGLYTGLAWWTKYNGWLPLAIEAAGIFILLCMSPTQRKRLNTLLACFAVTALFAAAVWLPYLFSLQSHGGYAPIAANHAKYFVGLSGWLDSAARQVVNQRVVGGWLSALGIWIGFSLPALLPGRHFNQRVLQFATATGIALIAVTTTIFPVVATVSLIGLVRAMIAALGLQLDRTGKGRPSGPDAAPPPDSSSIGLALLAAWWLGMFLMTPCYTPYARLALPFSLAAVLAAPLFMFSGYTAGQTEHKATSWQCWLPATMRLALVAIIAGISTLIPRSNGEWSRDRLGLFDIARAIRQTADATGTCAVYIYGEPALFFQLHAAGEEIIAPVQDVPITPAIIDGKPVPTFFIAGPNTDHDADFRRNWAVAGEKWILAHSYEYSPSALVRLDLDDPREKASAVADSSIRLYQLTTDQ